MHGARLPSGEFTEPAYLDPRYTSIAVGPSDLPIKPPLDPSQLKTAPADLSFGNFTSAVGDYAQSSESPLPSKLWTSTVPNADTKREFTPNICKFFPLKRQHRPGGKWPHNLRNRRQKHLIARSQNLLLTHLNNSLIDWYIGAIESDTSENMTPDIKLDGNWCETDVLRHLGAMLLSPKNIIIRHSSRAPVLRRLLQWDTFYLYCFWFSFKEIQCACTHKQNITWLYHDLPSLMIMIFRRMVLLNCVDSIQVVYLKLNNLFYREQIGPNSIVLIRYGWLLYLESIWFKFGSRSVLALSDILSERWSWPDRKKRQFCQKSVILRYLLCMEFAYFSPGANRF